MGSVSAIAAGATVALSFVRPFRDYIDSLIHPSVQQDPLTATRHRAFIAPRLFGSLIALAAFPVYLARAGVPSALEIAVFAWLVVPILTAYFLSRTGRYEGAHILSSLSLTGLVVRGRVQDRRHLLLRRNLARRGAAGGRVVGLAPRGCCRVNLRAGRGGSYPDPATFRSCGSVRWRRPTKALLAALGIVSASLYATGLALGAELLARAQLLAALCGGGPLSAAGPQHDRRHHPPRQERCGVVCLAGGRGAIRRAGRDLLGHGLFDRVHVADRPAYLRALANARLACASRNRSSSGSSVAGQVGRRDRFRLGGDALPAAGRAAADERNRARSRRGDARCHRAQVIRNRRSKMRARNPNAPTRPRRASSPP